MMDWVTAASLATAGGTLVLAVATFASISGCEGHRRRGVPLVGLGGEALQRRRARPPLALGMRTQEAEAIFGCRPNLLVCALAASSRRIAG